MDTDKLAKEAAQEATTLSTSFNVITINDVKQAAQKKYQTEMAKEMGPK